MPSVNQQLFSQSGLNLIAFTVSPSCLLQVGTVSMLILVIAQKATSEALISLGEASEELLRGDRLPVLPFPDGYKLDKD
ncbi:MULTISPECIES: hypothetical protein [Nostocales]|jgi:hypothetical protein|uniref:Uncharacterized protein n=2 Tax=Aphanizomenonaceae TaxID=1892259 RepID=A0ACC7S8U6_DOLFA|nr:MULTISPECIES: hypothetical protein [Nostocales]MBO1068563.1 hypothetical protein [Dolichospermum sp. DEX189]MCX5982465.1 hypothetical protein [Nostocales cyanobacterium LacPavin_0920_SED1_MAG_38_18]QSV69704.1 MAG: hypothetical protein HEQ20_01765 [Aphanizomenon flos-aquae KM1D3_PB]ALB41635.1 hypothetical protein AA650_15245 [Anabaena sp. WA102]KHG40454.1 hypothetical protein OA07_17410 [Aphanizomenon flos-aquae 2012/KM1/D3]